VEHLTAFSLPAITKAPTISTAITSTISAATTQPLNLANTSFVIFVDEQPQYNYLHPSQYGFSRAQPHVGLPTATATTSSNANNAAS
jgi:hypothetical protein